MFAQHNPHRPITHLGRTFALLLAAAALLPLTLASPAPSTTPHAPAALLALATEQPGAPISVIVQRSAPAHGAEDLVARLGGSVAQDLHIINAFAASLPARALPELARSPAVRWISLDAPVARTSASSCATCLSARNLASAYPHAIGADRLWNEAPTYLQGQGIGVAVVDSGITPHDDLTTAQGDSRIVGTTVLGALSSTGAEDGYGHGTHVAGVIAGNGSRSGGAYIGVAPLANLINVKVSDDQGEATTADVVTGLQWINDNRDRYNIRVVNISLNGTIAESYNTNPIDAAVEALWFNRIVVVVSAGNSGARDLFPPANDPFVITAGATNDQGTLSTADDTIAPFSAYGKTIDGFFKPELVAPGTNIISLLASPDSALTRAHSANVVDAYYFRMSGTSMAAPMVAGAVALLLQAEPNLTPDQVKYRLMATARPFDRAQRAGAGYLNIYAAVHTSTSASANAWVRPSQLLLSPSADPTPHRRPGSLDNGSAGGSVTWGSDYWGR